MARWQGVAVAWAVAALRCRVAVHQGSFQCTEHPCMTSNNQVSPSPFVSLRPLGIPFTLLTVGAMVLSHASWCVLSFTHKLVQQRCALFQRRWGVGESVSGRWAEPAVISFASSL